MIALLLTLTLTTTVTPGADLAYLGALLCGESCGMNQEAMSLVAENLALDYLEHGRPWLRRRWYAPLKYNEAATEIMRAVLELEVFRACRLVGNGNDADYWRANGYLPPDAVPDYEWTAHGMTVAAFGCVRRKALIKRFDQLECIDRCPQ